jgi:hypothetical protein
MMWVISYSSEQEQIWATFEQRDEYLDLVWVGLYGSLSEYKLFKNDSGASNTFDMCND